MSDNEPKKELTLEEQIEQALMTMAIMAQNIAMQANTLNTVNKTNLLMLQEIARLRKRIEVLEQANVKLDPEPTSWN